MASDSLGPVSQWVVRCRIRMLKTEPRASGTTIPPASNFLMILIKGMIKITIGKNRKTNTSLKVEIYLPFIMKESINVILLLFKI